MQDFVTKDSLTNLGIDLTGQDVDTLLDHLNDTLQERVSTEITEALNEKQLQALVALQGKATDEEIGTWLEANVPDFEQIVKDEIDILLDELVENADDITAVA